MKTLLMTFRNLPGLTLVCLLLLATVSPADGVAGEPGAAEATGRDESIGRSFWQLHPGNQLLVKGTVSRSTRISRPEQPDTTTQSRDQFDLLYVVEDVDPSGRLTISVRVLRALREPDTADRVGASLAERRLGLLEDIRLTMIVSRDGSIDTIAPGDPEAIAVALGGLHPASNGFLNSVCTPDVISSWVSRPFLMVVDPQLVKKDYQWTRPEVVSLGLFGSIRTHVDAQIQESAEQEATGLFNVRLMQNGPQRYLPARLPASLAAALPIQVKETTAEITELSGSATLFAGPVDGAISSSGPRPQFDAVSITIGVRGSCIIESGGAQQSLQFEQTQKQDWNLASWRTGQPRFVTPDGVPVPIPQPNP